MDSMVCQGLNCTSTKLINAHIIAKGFGRLMRGSGPNIRISPENVGTARQQLGEFDPGILCADCDGLLGRFDDYVVELCQKFEQLHTRRPEAFELPHADRELFGKFVLSVLWRASISKRPSVAVVRLGPYESKFRDVIFSSRSIDELPEAEIILQRYTVRGGADPVGMYFYPTRFKMAGDLNFYNFAVGGFRIRTKVDNRPLPSEIKAVQSIEWSGAGDIHRF